jgi:hypothetical protein
MTTKILKRCTEDARVTFMLIRELLVNCMGYTVIYQDEGGSTAFTADQDGTDGSTDILSPQIFSSAAATFSASDVNKYLVICTSATPHSNVGIYKVIGCIDANNILIQGGLYGGSFTTGLNLSWRLMDPAAVTDVNLEYVLQAVSGTAPLWQADFYRASGSATSFDITVGPEGGYDASTTSWTRPYTGTCTMACDATSVWTVLASESYIRLYTEAVGGASLFNLGYVGAGLPRRAAYDLNFAVCFAGVPITALTAIKAIASDLSTQIDYSAIYYGDSAGSMFTSLPVSSFDMRNDAALISVGSEGAFPEDDRGSLNGLLWISDQISYKSFVDNGRLILSLGSGLALEWDGSVAR